MFKPIAIVDYGRGNLFSVQRALEHVGAAPYLITTAEEIAQAKCLILPGVGAFADGMNALHQRELVKALQDYATQGKPLLGICLGMQMLFDESEEFGPNRGLGIISGTVNKLSDADGNAEGIYKIPHVGWTALRHPQGKQSSDWRHTPLHTTREGESVYFVHSYTAHPKDPSHRLADSLYFGKRIAATVRKGNVVGMQYHPEKSGTVGLQMLKDFLMYT
jgi:imidazole glycerol-phosphate synthase subunit HisH